MERLGDDELLCVFDKIPEGSPDRATFLQVSKRFMKIACLRRKVFSCWFPDLLFDILPSSPNLTTFSCNNLLSNAHLKLLPHCPSLRILDLRLYAPSSEFDFDDDGLCAVANACIHLQAVYLHKRVNVGDAGVAALATSCKDLKVLCLESINITDESLKALATSGIVQLKLLSCDRITDSGIIHLNKMLHLTILELGSCVHITDAGIVGLVSQLPNIRSLWFTRLKSITDVSLLAIGTKCLKLKSICFDGCEAITGQGLRGFRDHPTLRELRFRWCCYNLCREDVKSVAQTCIELEHVEVMKKPEENESFLLTGDHFYLLNKGGNVGKTGLKDSPTTQPMNTGREIRTQEFTWKLLNRRKTTGLQRENIPLYEKIVTII